MAAGKLLPAQWKYNIYGAPAASPMTFGEAASQSYCKGDLVYLVNGLVTVWANSATTQIAGYALQDATGVTSASQQILPIRLGDVFEMSMQTSDAVTVANLGVPSYGLAQTTGTAGSASAIWSIDNDTAYLRVTIIRLLWEKIPDNTTGELMTPVLTDTATRVEAMFCGHIDAATPLLQLAGL